MNYQLKAIKHISPKRFKRVKNRAVKKLHFHLSLAPDHHSFIFNLPFLYELKHNVRFCKRLCGIFHFRFRFAFIKGYIFVQQKA